MKDAKAEGPGIVFVDRRDKARGLAARLAVMMGGTVVWVTAEKSKAERKRLAEQMRLGHVDVAVATTAWSTGIDIPQLGWVVLTGRVRAPIGTLQSVGRALRPDGTKRYKIINISEEAGDAAAEGRAAVLQQAGFITDDVSFVDELSARTVQRTRSTAQQQVEQPLHWWKDGIGPVVGLTAISPALIVVVIVLRLIAYMVSGQ